MAEEFLDYHEIVKSHQVIVADLYLGGDAAHWLQWFKMRFPLSAWATFTTQLLQRFGLTDSLNFNMALSHIIQTTTIEAYMGQFIHLSCRTTNWIDAQLLGAFLGGLKDKLHDDVVALSPSSLACAIELAHIFKQKQGRRSVVRSGNTRSSTYYSKPPFSPSLNPSTRPVQPRPPSTTNNSNLAKPILQLTQTEIRNRREQGLCFICDEQYHLGHRCKQSHILMLLVNDDCPDLN
ncbi:hypothetical protein ACFX2A_023494 [Malus domestica]